MTDYQTARVSLGVRLRELREESGLSGRELAARAAWHPSKVSRLEHGKQTASTEDLRSWALLCGRREAAGGLVAQLRSLETHYASWRRQLSAGHEARQQSYFPLDEQTQSFQIFESACVPGFLQTAEYARFMFRRGARLHRVPDDGQRAVNARVERQRVLEAPGKSFHILMWEPALRLRLAPDTVMAAQLERISTVLRSGKAEIGVVPMRCSTDVVPSHGFWIFDDDRVLVETIGAELCLTEDGAVEPYRRVFSALSRSAVRGQAALELVERARRELTGPDGS
ncbi:helix-turn-helix domain-containing protein [Nocardiopsis xinjiangensis]|uniref:helix-turn-helix domain-containing protein n=1 Tax=Nocardiopsis xinjiangensis TaxID=124285 RepID=UPI000477BF39|nr:helix-turn-helix transcriptional regulator [Nocardiopsis xinjiangensis]